MPSSQKLPLDSLLLRLQREGFVFGVDKHLQLQQLLRALGHEYLNEPEELKRLLAPVLVRSREEQAKFHRIFDEYYREEVAWHISQVMQDGAHASKPDAQQEVRKRRTPRWLAPLIVVLSLGLLAAIFLIDYTRPLSPLHPQFGILADSVTSYASNQTPRFPIGTPVYFQNQTSELEAEGPVEARGIEFIWDFGDGSPRVVTQSESQVSHIYHEPGNYYVSLGAARTDGTADSTVSLPIEIYCPDALFLQFGYSHAGSSPTTADYIRFEPDVAGVAKEGLTYAWDFGDGSTATEASPSHQYLQSGSYTVRLQVRRIDTLDYPCANVASHSRFIAIAKPQEFITLTTLPLQRDVQPEAQMALTTFALILLALLAGLLILGAGMMLVQYRKRDYSPKNKEKYEPGDEGPFAIPYPPQDHLISPDTDLYALAAAMRRRQAGDTHKLDIRETIRDTIAALGMPRLAFDTASKPSEYVILIEQPYADSHQTRLFDRIVQILQGEDVSLETYFFDSDMRICWNDDHPEGINWDRLQQLHRNRRLVIYGNGYHLIDPFEAKLEAWVAETLEAWQGRALLLSPTPVADWGYKERILRQVFVLLPVDIQGQLAMVDKFNAEELPDYDTLRKELVARIPATGESLAEYDFESVEDLRRYLGPELFHWVAATMVYPWPVWEMTLAIGKALSQSLQHEDPYMSAVDPPIAGDGYLLTYTHLLRIARIPWMHHGDVPASLRLELMQALDPATERLARETVLEVLRHVRVRPHSFIAKKIAVQETTHRFLLSPGDEEIAREMHYLIQNGQITDQPLLRKLDTPSEQFNGESPQKHLKQRFAPVKPLEIAAAVLIGVLLSGAFGFMVREKYDRTAELKAVTRDLRVDSTELVRYIPQLDSAIFFNNSGVALYTDSADRVLSISQFSRAILYRQNQGQGEYALAYYNLALVNYNEGVVTYSNGQYEKAIRDFDLSLQQVNLPAELQRQASQATSERAKGELLFTQNCASCHAIDRHLAGPPLGGISEKYAGQEDWLYEWVRRAPQMIAEGDPRALALYEAYNTSMQPGFPHLANDDIDLIFAYIDSGPKNSALSQSTNLAAAGAPQGDSLSARLVLDNLHGMGLAYFYLGRVSDAQMMLDRLLLADSSYFFRVRPNLLDLLNAGEGAYRRYLAQADSSLRRQAWLMAITFADSALQMKPEDVRALAIRNAAQEALNELSITQQADLALDEARTLFGREEYALAKSRYEEARKIVRQDPEVQEKYEPLIEQGIAQCDEFLTGINSTLAFYSDLDAAADFGNGKVYLFQKDRCIRYDKRTGAKDEGFPRAIATAFPKLPAAYHRDLDAVLNYENTDIYFIKGPNAAKYNLRAGAMIAEGALGQFFPNWPTSFRTGVESATGWDNNRVYFTKGGDYIGFVIENNQVGTNYPQPIKETWNSLPGSWHNGFDAAFFSYSQKKCYIFKGSEYALYDSPTNRIEPGYPKPIARQFAADLGRTFAPVVPVDTTKILVNTPLPPTTPQPASAVRSIRNHLLQGDNIDFRDLSQFFKRNNDPQYIVLSHTATPNAAGPIAYILNENQKSKIGFHLVIGRDGRVSQLMAFDKYTYGLGRAVFNKKNARELEQQSILIELENQGWLRAGKGGYENGYGQLYEGEVYTGSFRGYDYWQPYTPAQLQAAEDVCRLLVQAYGITNILARSEIDAVKASPGPAFPLESFRAEVLAYGRMQQQQQAPPGAAYDPANEARKILSQEFSLPYLGVEIDAQEVALQRSKYPNAVDFEAALREAMRSFLEDGSHVESPLALLTEVYSKEKDRDARARTELRKLLNNAGARLILVPDNRKNYPPEQGESIEQNWVFYLRIPDLSDHLFWAIVDRSGKKKAYNYGFN